MKGYTEEELQLISEIKLSEGKVVKAIVGFFDLLGFSNQLIKNWDESREDFLNKILRIKSHVDLCKLRGNPQEFRDYDEETVLDTSDYPKIITFSDSFIFIKELDESSSQTIITSLLSLLSSALELWRYSIHEGFTIIGAIDYGEIFTLKMK